ncbi:2-amino-4-hydroxy-6-hydroxymethyldihydropteridine diphosphokinase [Indiicoccus explosivorum]|uniref:2-amino-4-hydroxy-6- hydroxymethyldihydropteridine diphosphokinase n=1 Tax=Indiicoccus explosivorum TaxID=1917864 RepID=UPI000B43BF9C|nr:2-amino-4-hydroxy-6-hydroxymethyldihydropteridine diphosphokinase [Indiicoccus explosivorum]
MNNVYLSIGSNIGDRLSKLQQAVKLLNSIPGTEVKKISAVYETAAVGLTDQADFLNAAVQIWTKFGPEELLSVCQDIERQLERERTVRWGPRTIDLDILLYNQDNIETERLTIPHPRMRERAFVLVPLAELNRELKEPHSDRLYRDLIRKAEGEVRLYREAVDVSTFLELTE